VASGSNSRRHRSPSDPRRSTVDDSDRVRTAARPPSNGCARSMTGQLQRSPYFSRFSARRTGEAAPVGWNAEHSSCSRPGTVSCALRAPPPIRSAASITVTATPAWASVTAPTRPFGPEPTTTAVVTVPPVRFAALRSRYFQFASLRCAHGRNRDRAVVV
jgi:hypothetical protein